MGFWPSRVVWALMLKRFEGSSQLLVRARVPMRWPDTRVESQTMEASIPGMGLPGEMTTALPLA